MHKNLTKMLIILGAVIIISAYTYRDPPVTAVAALTPIDLVETVPSNTPATIPIKAAIDTTCTNCHGGETDVSDLGYIPWVIRPFNSNRFTQALNMSAIVHNDYPTQVGTACAILVFHDKNFLCDGGSY